MHITKNSSTEDIIVGSVEQISNVFFEEESVTIEKLLNGEVDDYMFDMGIPYKLFITMINETYNTTEEDLLDTFKDVEYVSIFIDKMPLREVFEIEDVRITVDPYSDVVVHFNMQNVVVD